MSQTRLLSFSVWRAHMLMRAADDMQLDSFLYFVSTMKSINTGL